MKGIGRLVGGVAAATMAAGLATGVAQAQEATAFTFSANVGATTDYVFRGISQSDSEHAFQGGVDVGYGLFYGGVWASTIDFGLDEEAEVDFYGGIKPVVGPVTFDLGLIYYFYPGLDGSFNGDMLEVKAGASISPVDKVTVGATAYWSPQFTFTDDVSALYLEATAAYAIIDEFSISGAIGRQDVDTDGYYVDISDGDEADSYTTWNIGGTYAFEGVSLDLRYYDTDLEEVELRGPSGDSLSDNRFAVGLKLSF